MVRVYTTGKRKTYPGKQKMYKSRPNTRARIESAVFAKNPTRKQEIKSLDLTFVSSAILATGGIQLLNGVGIGDNTNEREGKAIQSMFVKLSMNVFNNTNCFGETYRIYLVWDKQPNGVVATWTDIFVNNADPTIQKQTTKQRYSVLKEWKGVITSNQVSGLSVAQNAAIQHDATIPMKKISMYTGTGTSIASIQQGALYLCAISRNTLVNITVSSQFGYIDI